tara:strand:+ start:772 stop:1008 length:237 start_codon:yes stop_codon:yes gene_type:complete
LRVIEIDSEALKEQPRNSGTPAILSYCLDSTPVADDADADAGVLLAILVLDLVPCPMKLSRLLIAFPSATFSALRPFR